jgi:hypothetical protein
VDYLRGAIDAVAIRAASIPFGTLIIDKVIHHVAGARFDCVHGSSEEGGTFVLRRKNESFE